MKTSSYDQRVLISRLWFLQFVLMIAILGAVAPAHAQGRSSPSPETSAKVNKPNYQPGDRASRKRALANLYAYLATAESKEASDKIATAIERIWLDSGSATVSLLMERALAAANKNKLPEAITLMDAVVAMAPEYTEAWNRRAVLQFMRGKNAFAFADLQRALVLDPNHFKVLDGLAKVMYALGDKKGALRILRQLRDVHPYWPNIETSIVELDREVNGEEI